MFPSQLNMMPAALALLLFCLHIFALPALQSEPEPGTALTFQSLFTLFQLRRGFIPLTAVILCRSCCLCAPPLVWCLCRALKQLFKSVKTLQPLAIRGAQYVLHNIGALRRESQRVSDEVAYQEFCRALKQWEAVQRGGPDFGPAAAERRFTHGSHFSRGLDSVFRSNCDIWSPAFGLSCFTALFVSPT